MKALKIVLFILVFLAFTFTAFANETAPGDVIVVLKNNSGVKISSATKIKSLSAVRSFTNSSNIKVTKTFDALSEAADNIFMLVHSDTKDENEILCEIKARPDVIAASLNHKIHLNASGIAPNDPEFYKLWGLEAINANYAWNFGTGSKEVYVAVIDSGVDSGHEDLKDNFSHQYSRNFVGNGTPNYDPNSYDDVADHGSHVAGIISAVGNNGLGVTGVNWKAKIISLRVFNENGQGYDADEISAINYLIALLRDNPRLNIAAVNLSLGGFRPYIPEKEYGNSPYYLALKALSDTNRTVICVAAGNEEIEVGAPALKEDKGEEIERGIACYPASYTGIANMIVVAASDLDFTRSSFSNYSRKYVDIAAPGRNIFSTVRTKASDDFFNIDEINRTFCYDNMSGTSMATPYVAGSAALLKAIFPEAEPQQIKAALLGGANGNYLRDDGTSMYGMLDLKGAVDFLAASVSDDTAPKIVSANTSEGIINQPYNFTFYATGTQPITWHVEGELPEGLSFSEGRITGTPRAEGTKSLILFADNDYGSDSFVFDINISKGIAPVIDYSDYTEDNDFNAQVNIQFTSGINLSGGSWPIKWDIVENNLPDNFNFRLDDETGDFIFVPTATGIYSFTIKAENYAGSDTKTFNVIVTEHRAPEIENKVLKSGMKGIIYGVSNFNDINNLIIEISDIGDTIKAEGTSSIIWDVQGLPNGLKFALKDDDDDKTIVIAGYPEEAGVFDVIVTARNRFGSDTKTFNINIAEAAPSLIHKSNDIGNISRGVYTRQLLNIAIGSAPLSFDINGTIPVGMDLITGINTAFLYGAPAETGTFNFSLYAYNDFGSDSADIVIKVVEPAQILNSRLPNAVKNEAYNFTFSSLYNVPLNWELSGGLPNGLTLSRSGNITGTPTEAGEFNFEVIASTYDNTMQSYGNFVLNVNDKPEITTSSALADVKINATYITALNAYGTEPILWSVSSGNLPAGLTLSSNGYIHGTPIETGTFAFTVSAVNAAGQAEKNFIIRITNDNNIINSPDITSPDNGGDSNQQLKIIQGPSRGVSSLTAGELSSIIEANKILAAVLPEVSVNVSNLYTFASVDCFSNVKISPDVPAGYALELNAFTRDSSGAFVRDTEADSNTVFYDSEGNITDTVPDNHIINISAWLDAGKVYAPVISAAYKTGERLSSSGGGCNAGGLGIFMLLCSLFFVRRKYRRS